MISLPRELAPWEARLAIFPPDLASEIGRMLPGLALAIGPMRTAPAASGGDPDGFTGIARRGSYERLLLTEWLLADEAPDEFARRASMGEHAFFQLARRTSVSAASSVAIFAAGPDQIGAPRLGALAALIVLAARAERAGARFAWGVLEQPQGTLFEEVTAASVLRLLRARTAVPARAEDEDAWADRAAQGAWEDAWIVGARPPIRAWKHGVLEIRDVLDPARRALAVIARAPRAAPREVEVELPAPPACVRLVRDPFAVTAPAPRRQEREVAPASNLLFGENGTKLLARSRRGEILAYPVPNSPNDRVTRPKRYRARARGVVAAAGWIRRALVMLVVTEDEIIVEHTTTKSSSLLRGTMKIPVGVRVVPAHAADPLAPLFFHALGSFEQVLFLDARTALFRVRHEGASGFHVDQVASEVSAISGSARHLAYVGRDTERAPPERPGPVKRGIQTIPPGAPPALDRTFSLVSLRYDAKGSTKEALEGNGTFEAVFGGEDHLLLAVQQRGEVWSIPPRGHIGPPVELTPPPGTRVVGVWQSGPASEPELLVLEPDRRTISFVGRRSSRTMPRAAAPIVDVVRGPRAQLAYATAEGEVVIHSLLTDTPLARFGPADL